jgi:hypothetical protein
MASRVLAIALLLLLELERFFDEDFFAGAFLEAFFEEAFFEEDAFFEEAFFDDALRLAGRLAAAFLLLFLLLFLLDLLPPAFFDDFFEELADFLEDDDFFDDFLAEDFFEDDFFADFFDDFLAAMDSLLFKTVSVGSRTFERKLCCVATSLHKFQCRRRCRDCHACNGFRDGSRQWRSSFSWPPKHSASTSSS